jgi:hypothetical protein
MLSSNQRPLPCEVSTLLGSCVGVKVGVKRDRASIILIHRLCICPANEQFLERRRRDSNPRYPVERYNTLAGCRLQPLGHSSTKSKIISEGAMSKERIGLLMVLHS